MTYGPDSQPATSEYLNREPRSFEQAMSEHDDKYHRIALGELLQREESARLQYLNCGNEWGHLSTYDKRISALKYAIGQLEQAAAQRIKGELEDVG